MGEVPKVRSSDPRRRESGTLTGLALLLPITLSTMAIVLLAPVMPQLMAEYAHLPNADLLVPVVLTMPALCLALMCPVAGIAGDYFGRRRLLLLSLGVYGVIGMAPLLLSDLAAIIASRAAVGVAEALILVSSTTLIGDLFAGRARERWLAAQTAVASLSGTLFFVVGGALGQFGWRTPFWVYASALAMLALVLAFTWEPAGDAGSRTRGDAGPRHTSWSGFPAARMAGIILVTIFGSILFYTVQIQAPTGLAAHGVTDPARAGLLSSIASLGVPIGTVLYARFGRRRVAALLLAELLLIGAGFLLMSFADGSTGFLVGSAVNQVGAGMLLPTLLVWAVSQLSFEFRARGTGLWQSAFSLGQFLSPLLVALLTRLEGGLLPAFQWLGYAAFAGALVAMAALRQGGRGKVEREQAA